MRIEAITTTDVAGGRRVSARLVAEGRYAGPDTLWYETDAAFAADFDPAPELFLLAATPAAVHYGEPRVRVDASVCPRFLEGLDSGLRVYQHWDPRYRPPRIESGRGTAVTRPRGASRAAAFVSGGVDSLSMLAANRATLPLDHPGAIADGFFVFGLNSFDFDGQTPDAERLRSWREQLARLSRFAAATDWVPIPVRTNVRTLYPDFDAWKHLGFGPATLAIAHGFRRRVTDAWIASHGYGVHQRKYSSHPLVDSSFSSGAVEIHHGEPTRLRHEKLADVAAWDDALDVLQVCFMHEPLPQGVVNCGRCEKCVRTMVGLLGLGRLERATTFSRRDLSATDLSTYSPAGDPGGVFSAPLIAGLVEVGRHDLARVLARRLAHARRKLRRSASWWGRLRRRLRRRRPKPSAVRAPGTIGESRGTR